MTETVTPYPPTPLDLDQLRDLLRDVSVGEVDEAERERNLQCTRCGLRVCLIEHGDRMDVLVGAALDHLENGCAGIDLARGYPELAAVAERALVGANRDEQHVVVVMVMRYLGYAPDDVRGETRVRWALREQLGEH